MPGIIPRLKDFAREGFGWLASLMAIVFYAVRLLPAGHPYLNAANKGRFGVHHVIVEAANRLVLKKENIDQIIIFAALVAGFMLLIVQFLSLAMVFVIKPALAAPPPFLGMFSTANPQYDIAFMLLDSVFGVPGVFTGGAGGAVPSCIASGNLIAQACDPTFVGPPLPGPGFPSPFQIALHTLFQFYSLAILVVGVLIFLYYVVILVGETATSGTPFGRRFANIWAPIRLVVALGLLVPINYGLNSAQYITLYAAKLGSGFATNGWLLFNNGGGITNGVGIQDADLIAKPKAPEIGDLIEFMAIVRACKTGYETLTTNAPDPITIEPYLVKNGAPPVQVTAGAPTWLQAVTFYDNHDIVIRFGHDGGQAKYPYEPSYVLPLCGEVTVHTKNMAFAASALVQSYYFGLIKDLYYDPTIGLGDYGIRAAYLSLTPRPANVSLPPDDNPEALPSEAFKQDRLSMAVTFMQAGADMAYDCMRTGAVCYPGFPGAVFAVPQDVLNRGWGGAGIWYNKIADWNGALFETIYARPSPSRMPLVMERIKKDRSAGTQNAGDACDQYNPATKSQGSIPFNVGIEQPIATMLYGVYNNWCKAGTIWRSSAVNKADAFTTAVSAIFGLNGLFDMRKNYNVHPMAQLSAMGKGILDAAIRNLVVGILGAGAAGFLDQSVPAQVAGVISGMAMTIVGMGLTFGFMLYYVLPALPFVYFFFAVGSWIKTVFEAMVGAPLWALAHLRIDGNGLPGETALNGYFLIFEIFIRPILTVFGLLASLAAFSAMVKTLNGIYNLVTLNLTGFDWSTIPAGSIAITDPEFVRGPIDQFFYTIIYAILVYMIGTASFKMIDRVPDGILRWMGAGVKTFGDNEADASSSQLMQYAAIQGSSIANEFVGAAGQGAQAAGKLGNAGLTGLFGRNGAQRLGGNY